MPSFRWHLGTGTRSRAGISVRNPFAILAAVVLIGAATAANSAPPHNVIQSGTPVNLGQYCTAVLGSTSHPDCLAKEQGETGHFKQECDAVAAP
jgi:hypothetical protein